MNFSQNDPPIKKDPDSFAQTTSVSSFFGSNSRKSADANAAILLYSAVISWTILLISRSQFIGPSNAILYFQLVFGRVIGRTNTIHHFQAYDFFVVSAWALRESLLGQGTSLRPWKHRGNIVETSSKHRDIAGIGNKTQTMLFSTLGQSDVITTINPGFRSPKWCNMWLATETNFQQYFDVGSTPTHYLTINPVF